MLGMPTIIEFNSVEENISFALMNGYEFIELNLNLSYVRDFLESKKKLDTRIQYTMHFFDEADFGLYQEVSDAYLKLMNKYLRLSKGYIKQLNVHLNVGPIQTVSGVKNYLYEKEFDTYINRLKMNLLKAKKICNKYGVTLVLENIKSKPFILKTLNALENEFYFNYDIGHDYTDGNRLNEYFNSHLKNYKEMHLHDSTASSCHLELGTGNLKIEEIYHSVASIPYIVIEVKCKKDLINSINYLRR